MPKLPPHKTKRPAPLLLVAVDRDLVRFEKNLLQIGFFGAKDSRDKNPTSRRIEQVVFRNEHKIKVAIGVPRPGAARSSFYNGSR